MKLVLAYVVSDGKCTCICVHTQSYNSDSTDCKHL